MMNGRRKSDRPVVATKHANKVGATANKVAATMAERVERRGLAKGKPPGQTRTGHRTGKSCKVRSRGYGKLP